MNEQTPLLGLPLPHPANDLGSDVLRLRDALQALDGHVGALQAALQSDDVALDQLQELVDAIKANRGDIAALLSLKASADALEAEVQARQQGDQQLAQQLAAHAANIGALQWHPITADHTLVAGRRYALLASVAVTLPDNPAAGDVIELTKLPGVTPVIQSGGALIAAGGQSDAAVTYNINSPLTLVYSGTRWEI